MTATVTPITETCPACLGKRGHVGTGLLGHEVLPMWFDCLICKGRGIVTSNHVLELRLKRSLRAPRQGWGR